MDENNKYNDLFESWRKFSNGQEKKNSLQETAIYKYDPTKPGEKGIPVSRPGTPTQGQTIAVGAADPSGLLGLTGIVLATDLANSIFAILKPIFDLRFSELRNVLSGAAFTSGILTLAKGFTSGDIEDIEEAGGSGSLSERSRRLEDSSTAKKWAKRIGWTTAGIGILVLGGYLLYKTLKETKHPELKGQPKSRYSGLSASEWENWSIAAQCAFCEENGRKPRDYIAGIPATGPECSDILKRCKDLDKEVSDYSLTGVGDEEALMRMLYAETSWKRGKLEMAAICQIAVNRLKKSGKDNMIDVVAPQTSGWNDASKYYSRNFIAASKKFKTPAAERARTIIQNVMRGNSPVGDLNGAQNFIHPGSRLFKKCSDEEHLTKLGKKFMCYDLAALPGGRRYRKTRIPLWSVYVGQGGTSKSIPRLIGTILISNGDPE
jgi:hypothetical protein